MKKILQTFLLLGWMGNLMAQSIQRIEYFIDSDPGMGNGVNIPFSGTNIATASLNIPTNSGVSDGFHKFFVRAKDSNSRWSVVFSQNFFKVNISGTPANIVKLEYFIDTDPGFGLANNITVTAGQSLTKDFSIPLLANLPLGFHKIYLRAKDASGKWSTVFHQNFFKSDLPSTVSNLVKLEYFIDSDPGFGLGINIPITAGQSATKDLSIALPSGLPLGFHKFYIRAKDASGKWSEMYQQNFYKTDLTPSVPNLVKLEYFMGADPGFGNGTNIPITAQNTLGLSNFIFAVSGSIPLGTNQLTIRARDASGKWSMVAMKSFTNCPGVTIASPDGLVSCSTALPLNAQLQNPELGGDLKWFRNGVQLVGESGTSLSAIGTGKYRVTRTTLGCENFASSEVQVNILDGTEIKLTSTKTDLFCNESFTLKIDTLNSNLPVGIPVLIDWFKDSTALVLNSGQTTRSENQAGTYKLRLKTTIIPGSCQTFDSDTIQIQNQNLAMTLGPQDSPNTLSLCVGRAVSLQANKNMTENITYKWFKNNNLINSAIGASLSINNEPGIYQVRGSIGACIDIPSANLTVTYAGNTSEVPVITVTESLNQTFCGGDTLHLSATGCTNGTKWSFGASGNQVVHVMEGTIIISASCQAGCLGNQSNILVVNSEGFKGNASEIQYAIYPFKPDYHYMTKLDHVKTYNGVNITGLKSLFGGGSLSFGTYNGTLFEKISSQNARKGSSDYLIRNSFIYGLGPTNDLFGGSGFDYCNGYFETAPHQYILFGDSNSPVSGDISGAPLGGMDFWILKYNYHTSQKLFNARFGGSGTESLQSMAALSNGELLLAGYSDSPVSGNKSAASFGGNDFWVVKTDAEGNKISDFSYGGTGDDILKSILKINDNEFVLFGTSNSPASGNKTIANLNSSMDYWAVWINANGGIIRQKVYGGNANEEAIKALISSTGELYFAGNSTSGISGDKSQVQRGLNDFWLIKTSATGEKIWDKTLGGNKKETLASAGFTLEENIALFGNTTTLLPSFERKTAGFSNVSNTQDTWLIELSPSGSIVTDYIMGSCDFDEAFPVLETDLQGKLLTISNITRTDYLSSCSVVYRDISGLGARYPVFLALEKARFKDDQNLFCKNSEIFVRAKTPKFIFNQSFISVNNPATYASNFSWSNGQTKSFFKTTVSDTLELRFKYKILGQNCYSKIANAQLKRFPDQMVLSGTDFSRFSLLDRFVYAYNKLTSTKKITPSLNTRYTSERAIELNPGFEIKASANNKFKAEIGGCTNQ